MINGVDTLQLKGLGYEDMAGTYTCTVTSIGGQNSGSGTLEVYCEYYTKKIYTEKNLALLHQTS